MHIFGFVTSLVANASTMASNLANTLVFHHNQSNQNFQVSYDPDYTIAATNVDRQLLQEVCNATLTFVERNWQPNSSFCSLSTVDFSQTTLKYLLTEIGETLNAELYQCIANVLSRHCQGYKDEIPTTGLIVFLSLVCGCCTILGLMKLIAAYLDSHPTQRHKPNRNNYFKESSALLEKSYELSDYHSTSTYAP